MGKDEDWKKEQVRIFVELADNYYFKD